jgi:hypothetical protein
MMVGVPYFPTVEDAHAYYAPLGGGASGKIRRGEIHIGKPPLKAGQRAHLMPDQGGSRRYFVEDFRWDGF